MHAASKEENNRPKKWGGFSCSSCDGLSITSPANGKWCGHYCSKAWCHGIILYSLCLFARVHETQSVQLGWVGITAKFRDYISLVMSCVQAGFKQISFRTTAALLYAYALRHFLLHICNDVDVNPEVSP